MTRYNWPIEMQNLLRWMRSEGMSYSFCAEIISRETKRTITKNACIRQFYNLQGLTR